ncbi:MAG: hypothetical protein IT305_16490 [Chloroflexi bacterium]|nr:hypothetical protein [Chloroflexota bacterium]
MPWIPPYPRRAPVAEDYCDLGQDEDPRVWIPVGIGMLLVVALLLIATLLGKV